MRRAKRLPSIVFHGFRVVLAPTHSSIPGYARDGSFRQRFSSWRVDQWVEVDRPAHAEELRNQHTRCILVPERFAQAFDGRPAKIVGNAIECSVPCPLLWRHVQLLANS